MNQKKLKEKLQDIFNELELSDHSEVEFSEAYVKTFSLFQKREEEVKQDLLEEIKEDGTNKLVDDIFKLLKEVKEGK